MTEPGKTLAELRREIDEIDTALHDLILRRGDLVELIREVKSRDAIANIRPGREAQILRRLRDRHRGRFPLGAVMRIWREIIASITRMEMPEYSIAVYVTADRQSCWDLARDQFGSRTPMTAHGNPRDVVAEVWSGKATVGVVPCPTEDHPDSWWAGLCAPGAPQIIYRLPFFSRGNARGGTDDVPDALALARIEPEATGDDRSLLVLETAEALSRSALGDLLRGVELMPRLLVSHNEGTWFHFAEIEGFLARDDARFARLEAHSPVQRASIIGNYAVPLDADRAALSREAAAPAATATDAPADQRGS